MPIRRLPVRPDLNQLKRQAKDLLHAIHSGDPAAISDLRDLHPDPVPPSETKLSDAQLILARSYEAPSWTRLVQSVKLVNAIWRDDIGSVRKLVADNPSLIHEDALIRKDSNWGPPMTYDELEIARWLLDQGMDVNARAAVGANGFGGYTALFATVVSQPNFWMNYKKRGPFVAPFTELLLERGADPNVRASIWKQLHPGHGDTTRHEYRDVTALSWGRQFHDPIFVSQPAMRLIEDAGGVD